MKKVILVFLVLSVLVSVSIFADDLSEFKDERERLRNSLAQYQQVTLNIQKRLVELDALIVYLEQQAIKEEPEEKSKKRN